ncbi:hypothetical protein Nlim_1124 [Candidatus Nitrosarchaeum limnium SFB1]|jgi:hypothetical protein|uniref:Uncharacterized protein n=1 Tax=Candidatus Nitrosarchaeum limnium SFB1 TaxID=886738 RepID=F3KKV0_9ARCH|nr:hypothetical protein Nlim_1124 [Candidatus Nitrosarchaeum limnium SFB1]
MDISTVSRKPHIPKKEKTRTVTFRFPEKIIQEIETEAMNRGVSQNVLVRQILEKFVQWDRFGDKIGMIPVPRGILQSLGVNLEGSDINMIVEILKPVIKDNVLFMKGKYDLKRCIETLEDYMRASGMKSDHRIEGSLHHFIVQHELGMTWSLFTEQLLKEIFHEFLPEKNVKTQTTEHTVIVTIGLGSDFNEHDY